MASAGDVSLDELQKRLLTFTEQLESIHELLQTDSENMEYINIAKDLVEVIRLTNEMIELKMNGKGGEAATTGPTDAVAAVPAPVFPEDASSTVAELKFAPGTMVEASSQGTWYPAFIESVTDMNTYNVHYLGFGSKDELKESMLRAISPDPQAYADQGDVSVGMRCEAKYYVDGQYYVCSVTETTDHGFRVLFDGYGNSEEVPLEYMRPVRETVPSAAAVAVSQKEAAPKVVLNKPIKIPENLQILPTDTEEEKERKRKRIKSIKSLNRHKNYENERNLKQQDWKSFQSKAMKKGFKGTGALSRRGTSMFASPETVDGRVGVVGSGQGMTTFVDTRKKHKRADGTAKSIY
ncbi:TPA: hypothetical protein N0F65_004935 [Lagenidium giganteum]|uniref:Tudor domain-containing protein n=1 Tax=Lagenidium giganteum TaxID=4803 RepID=A0AAV2YZA3_9STRA|nr:TPA: hypothetical protein N0F65_004935 [Lagenidium giganteum]